MSDEAKLEKEIEAGVEHGQPSASVDEVIPSASPNVSEEDPAVQKDETETEAKSPADAKDDMQKEPEAQENTSDDTLTASGSIPEEVRTVDNVEAGITTSPPVSRVDRCMECGLMEHFIRVLLYVITITFIIYFITTFFNPSTPDHMYGQIVAGIFIALIILFILILLTIREWNYDISWPWNQMSHLLGRMRTRSVSGGRNLSDSGDGDIESQTTTQADFEMTAAEQEHGEGAVDKNVPQPCNNVQNVPSTSGEKGRLVVSTITSDVCSVTKVSEVASAISSIASGTLVLEKTNVQQTEETPPEPKVEPTDEISNSEAKRSDSEPLSSGEIRRRKFQNVGQCTVSSSSDEEAGRKSDV